VIVDDVADPEDRVRRLWNELEPLMGDEDRRLRMSEACKQVARPSAAADIASRLLELAHRGRTAGMATR
jgi:UDP-N-acetylglucosamine:LPS N-acetylglucosamine transferase